MENLTATGCPTGTVCLFSPARAAGVRTTRRRRAGKHERRPGGNGYLYAIIHSSQQFAAFCVPTAIISFSLSADPKKASYGSSRTAPARSGH